MTRRARRYSAHPWASPLRGQRRRCSKLLPAILSGQIPCRLVICPTGCRQLSNPGRGFSSPRQVLYAKKKPVLTYELFLKYGGEGGIDSLRSPLLGPSLGLAPSGSAQALFKIAPGNFVGADSSQARHLSNWLSPVVEPRSGLLIPPGGVQQAKKKARTCVRALL
ncbi:hypothetical protein SB6413_02111 [Klebsiella pasteurii]|nr:hypothetical protein [Klebsiella sp. 1400]VUT16144.1 hypothetical protein SB6413_02111 [Klebsiella pasteurii]